MKIDDEDTPDEWQSDQEKIQDLDENAKQQLTKTFKSAVFGVVGIATLAVDQQTGFLGNHTSIIEHVTAAFLAASALKFGLSKWYKHDSNKLKNKIYITPITEPEVIFIDDPDSESYNLAEFTVKPYDNTNKPAPSVAPLRLRR